MMVCHQFNLLNMKAVFQQFRCYHMVLFNVNSLQMNHLPSFYREVLKQWQSTKQAFQNDTSPHDEIIWNNRNIKIDGKTRFYKDWFEKNIFYVLKTFYKMTEISCVLINSPKNFILKRRLLYILD